MTKDQSSLLEELRQRQLAAQVRLKEAAETFQESQQTLATAQAMFQKSQAALAAAQQQMHGWSIALATVEAEEAERKQVKNEKQLDLPAVSATPETQLATPLSEPEETTGAAGKTEMVRDLVRQHPQGMTATEIWSHVQDRFNHRAYLYNILKRLTKNGEFSERRGGKYVSRIAAPEVRQAEEVTTVH